MLHFNIDKFRANLLYLYIVTIPFSIFGFRFFNYDFSIPFLFLSIYSLSSIFLGKFNRSISVFIFFSFVFISTLISSVDSNSNSFYSFLVLSIFLIPLVIGLPKGLKSHTVYDLVVKSIYISLFLWSFEALSFYFNIPTLLFDFPFSLKTNGNYKYDSFLVRFSGGFREPSWYSYFLVASYIFIYHSQHRRLQHIILSLIAILLCGSLSGIFMVSIHYFFNNIKYLFKLNTIYVLIVLFFLVLISFNFSISSYLGERIITTINVFGEMNGNSSEAVRVNSIFVGIKYFQDGLVQPLSLLFGEGYGNNEEWIMNKFSGFSNEYALGFVTNLLVVNFISLGFIGLFLYLIMIYDLSKKYLNYSFFIIYIIFLNSTGFLVFFLTWHFFYLNKINYNFHTKE